MAHHYAGGTPEEHELNKQERMNYVVETIGDEESGEINFEGVREALTQDIRQDTIARIEGMELAKKDDNYFHVLETVAHSDTQYTEEMAKESNLSRGEFFATLGQMAEEGYLVQNGSTELTDQGESALIGTYILMDEHE
ncbi:MAG: hypothetical protein R6V35_05200 [Candidatus Nanohaloarchaea archaeon]